MEEDILCEISRHAEQGAISVSDLVLELSRKMPHIEETCNMTSPITGTQESDMGHLCNNEEGLSEMADLQMDLNTASNLLEISDDLKFVSRSKIEQNRPETEERFQWPQVLSSQSFSSGRHVWEVASVESRSWIVGMCYPSIDRKKWQSVMGNNPKSWALVRSGDQFFVIHDKKESWLVGKISSDRVRIYLDYMAGKISFYELSDPTRLLHTFTATFTEPLHAALCVWEGCMTTSGRSNVGDGQLKLDVTQKEDLLLDVNTAFNKLFISHDRKTASWSYHPKNRPNLPKRFDCPQVLSCQSFFSGRHYWEVDVGASDNWRVGMCYPSIDRAQWHSVIGNNHKSWCLVRSNNCYLAVHDSKEMQISEKISCNRFSIFLDYEAGQLSFYALSKPICHLHTFTTTFTEPLHAALWVSMGCIKISGGRNAEGSVQFSDVLEDIDVLLDVNTANNLVVVSDDRKMASWTYDNQYRPKTPNRFLYYPQVMSNQRFSSGHHYWEVDVGLSYSWRVGMCYPSIDRKGRPGSLVGNNKQSWSLDMDGSKCSVRHAGNMTELPNYISSNTISMYLDYEAGKLSFYEVCSSFRHLHTFTAIFTEPLHAIVCVWEGCITVSGMRSCKCEQFLKRSGMASLTPETLDYFHDSHPF